MVRPTAWQPDAVPYNNTRLTKEIIMPDLFDQIFRSTIGFDPLKNYVTSTSFNNYPPFNIFKTSILDEKRNHLDPAYRLEMAVAGFSKDMISVYIEDGLLVVKGEDKTENKIEHEYLYRGLSFRDFERTFQLGKNIEVTEVTLQDGLLSVLLKEIVPEVNRKTFDIK